MAIIRAVNIEKIYGGSDGQASTKALNKINIDIEEGEFVGIMGSSGSGKTTLLNMFSGIDKPTSGYVKVENRKLEDMSKSELAFFRRRRMGFVFQEFNLLDTLTLKENIMLPMILDKKDEQHMDERSNKIMKLFNIDDIGSKYPYNVSGGQQQRAAVSRAIINDAKVIFADEPTGNLDSKSSKTVMECFEKLNVELKKTILVVTHDIFAASYCNRIIFIKDGSLHSEIVKKGNNKEFFDRIMNCLAVLGSEGNEV